MTAQPAFNFTPPNRYVDEFISYRETELGQAAELFHAMNPHVYDLFLRFAKQALTSGRERFGIAAIWERMRWEAAFNTTGEEFKISNNHRAYYARKLMAQEPGFEAFFVIKEARQ